MFGSISRVDLNFILKKYQILVLLFIKLIVIVIKMINNLLLKRL